MKKFIDTLTNIWKIDELRTRILATLGFLLIYRLGSFVVLPGVDSAALEAANGDPQGLAALINTFAGGAFSRASVFALGIMPYISASIVMQLMGIIVPSIQKMQKEGESGRKKINQWTRFLTIAITCGQAPAFLKMQIGSTPGAIVVDPSWFYIQSTIILIAGTMFIMWLGEKITDKGIGNGISLIIMIGIIANLPTALLGEFEGRMNGGGGIVVLLIEMVLLLLVILVSIMLVQGVRRVPVEYAKKIVAGGSDDKKLGGARNFIPLKVNAAGVMPIIFAQAIMFVPMTIAGAADLTGVAAVFQDITGFWYNFTFAIVIILFTYFYTAITFPPTQIADDLKRGGGFVPGVKPGVDTVEFLDGIISKITLPGSIFLAIISILPAFAMMAGVNNQFSYFFGGTSLLIMVGVVLDTLQQIESHLLMRHYDGLMKTGKLKGRTSVGMAG